MKYRITYKEITILIGLLVAAAVVLTLWMRTPQTPGDSRTGSLQSSSLYSTRVLHIQVTEALFKIAGEIIH